MRRTTPPAGGVRAHILRRLVRDTVTCAICGRRYRLDRLRFVGHQEGVWAYLALCGRCRAIALIGVVLQDGQPVIRDVTTRELKRFQTQPPVNADDVLNMHELLAHFDGDFAGTFQRE